MALPRRRGRLRSRRGSGTPPPSTPGVGAADPEEETHARGDGNTADIGIQVDLGNGRLLYSACLRLIVGAGCLVIGMILAVLSMEASVSLLGDGGFGVSPDFIEDMGMEGLILFRQHDRDSDGYLSLEEFEPVAHRLSDVNETFEYDSTIQDWDEVLTVQALFKPLLLDSLSNENRDYKIAPGTLDPLKSLREWKTPTAEWQNFGADHFKGFLPADKNILHKPGQVYHIIPIPDEMARGPTLSSNRYYPPRLVRDGEIIIHRLLTLFHHHTFVYSRFAPQGSVACVRAVSEEYVDIMFRIHAEFQLNEAPFYPFWFTPGQFTGNLIIDKKGSKVLSFHLYVPTKNRLNVDMEWLNAPLSSDNMEVDIGFMPQMELRATRSSVNISHSEEKSRKDIYLEPGEESESVIRNIKWTQEIDREEVLRKLEVQLYRFKEVPYYNLSQALRLAQEEKKPIHSIMLWGVLDDQSC